MKVGIIGAGAAGLATAWLLDKDHEIILFERQERIGGHAQTVPISVNGETVPIEAGFEFFNDRMFPYFSHLLKLLGIPVCAYPLSYTFTSRQGIPFIVPPLHNGNIIWQSLTPSYISTLLQFKYLIHKAHKCISDKDTSITLKNFIEQLHVTRHFKDNFFYPFLAAGWGTSLEDFKTFSAYNVLSWIVKNAPSGLKPILWNDIVFGTTSYITALVQDLTHTHIKLGSAIKHITYTNNSYSIQEENGTTTHVDTLIIATNAHEAIRLLSAIPETEALRSNLATITYFPTTIAIHGDYRFMPLHKSLWSIANIRTTKHYSALTIYKPWKSIKPLFRSWITPDDTYLPEPLYALIKYRHARVDYAYFKAQSVLEEWQGNNQLWLAGLYTTGIDSHESALVSALTIAQQLAPHSQRLHNLITLTGVQEPEKAFCPLFIKYS